jgi:hypothetical protein
MKTGRGTPVLLGLALVIGAVFVAGFVFPYFALNQQTFGSFWPERGWLLLHIVAGMAALLLGPFVLWLGLNRRRMSVHRRLGIGYMTSVGLSGIGALYLAFHTDLGWEYAMGLVGLATAWLVTTGLALASIRRRLIEQHKEMDDPQLCRHVRIRQLSNTGRRFADCRNWNTD